MYRKPNTQLTIDNIILPFSGNISFYCQKHKIQLGGPKLGSPPANTLMKNAEKISKDWMPGCAMLWKASSA